MQVQDQLNWAIICHNMIQYNNILRKIWHLYYNENNESNNYKKINNKNISIEDIITAITLNALCYWSSHNKEQPTFHYYSNYIITANPNFHYNGIIDHKTDSMIE